jgi:hypothetical protein
MKRSTKSLGLAGLSTAVALAIAFSSVSGEAADVLNRYPFDPACPWGRIANGRGMVVRCLSQTEAAELAQRAASGAVAEPLPAPTPGTPDVPPAAGFTAELRAVRVSPDIGKLPEAEKKLSAAKERFLSCVADNGGLEEQKAEVQVRFLVRARGRAEGVSVAKKSGLSSQAAQCVADVVDRRQVGIPEEPIVGATVVIQFAAR